MSEFLSNLKKAVEEGDFNSDVAKKINEIDELADKVSKDKSEEEIQKSINDRIKQSGVKTINEEKIGELNSECEMKMYQRSKEEIILATIATLTNMDYSLERQKDELSLFIEEQKNEYDPENEEHAELYKKINELIKKYEFDM